LQACIQEKGLQNFPICQNLDRIAQEAPSKINQVIQRWRIQKEIANDIVKLALYDIVLYIGGSVKSRLLIKLTLSRRQWFYAV
jgi:hypothetical protein